MKIIIPETQDEITIAQWQKLDDALKLDTSEILKKFQVVSILCNIPFEDLIKLQQKDIFDIYGTLINVINETPNHVKTFVVDGVTFGFIPDLDSITTAEYLDLNTYIGTDIERTMAVLYRPIKKAFRDVYTIEKYKGTDKHIELIRKAPASAYTSSLVFFWDLGKELLLHTTEYLEKNLTAEELTLLSANGVGISQLTQLHQAIEQSIVKL
jgi:hypothetical protein